MTGMVPKLGWLIGLFALSVLVPQESQATVFHYNAVNDFDINHNPATTAVMTDVAISNAWSYGVSPSMAALAANQFTYMNVRDRASVRVDTNGNLLAPYYNGAQPNALQQYPGPFG